MPLKEDTQYGFDAGQNAAFRQGYALAMGECRKKILSQRTELRRLNRTLRSMWDGAFNERKAARGKVAQ